MVNNIRWSVVLACPGENELPLLAELSARRDAQIVAVADPDGTSLGAELATIMGIPVVQDLELLDLAQVQCLVHGALSAAVTALLDDAHDLGLEAVRADVFTARLHAPVDEGRPRIRTAARPSADLEALEGESAAIHRTLSRVEEALDREVLLRWMLGLAMRAVGATSGSIMLLDESTDELYVAFARGLSDATMHRTRVRPGEGISGRVAATGHAERIEAGGDPDRDRGDLADAVCAPISYGGQVLGVVNLSSAAGDGPLVADALERVQGLSHRFGGLLRRFLRLQDVVDRDRWRQLDETLGLDLLAGSLPLELLGEWVRRLAAAAGAAAVEIALLTCDGDLCVIGAEGIRHESPPDHDKLAVLVHGAPFVARSSGDDTPRTVIHLPIGREPRRAVLTLVFAAAAAAHRFRATSSDFLYVVRRHLGHVLDQTQRVDEINRLTALASALSSLAEMQGEGENRARVLAAARRLTGARAATIVEDGNPGDPLLDEARRLLAQAGDAGWAASILDSGADTQHPTPVSVLVVPLDTTRPLPGLLLVGKDRVHPLDAGTFTETDARFVRRVLPLLQTRPAALAAADAAAVVTASSGTMGALAQLRREVDRCDRYHTMVGLAAFRCCTDGDLHGLPMAAQQTGPRGSRLHPHLQRGLALLGGTHRLSSERGMSPPRSLSAGRDGLDVLEIASGPPAQREVPSGRPSLAWPVSGSMGEADLRLHCCLRHGFDTHRHGFEHGRPRARVEPPRHEDVRLGIVHGQVPWANVGKEHTHGPIDAGLRLQAHGLALLQPQTCRIVGVHEDHIPACSAPVHVFVLVHDRVELPLRSERHQTKLPLPQRKLRHRRDVKPSAAVGRVEAGLVTNAPFDGELPLRRVDVVQGSEARNDASHLATQRGMALPTLPLDASRWQHTRRQRGDDLHFREHLRR